MKLLTSSYLDPDREHNNLIIWADNCGRQNKNYILYQTLHTAVHSQFVRYDKVTINYFVARHSFMAADAFHAAVEFSIKRNSVLLNIGEFEVCLKDSGYCTIRLLV